MEDWNSQGEQPKTAGDILVSLFDEIAAANLQFAEGKLQHDEWAAEMRLIDQRLAIFGLRIDRPERFASKLGR